MIHYDMVPLSPLQVMNGQALHHTFSEASPSTLHRVVEVDEFAALRAAEPLDPALPVDPLVLRAVARALTAHPWMNAHLVEDELCQYREINLGVMLARADGLIAPVIHDVAAKSAAVLEDELRTLVAASTQGAYDLRDMQIASFIVMDLGRYGIDQFAPVLPVGPVGALGVNRIRRVCVPARAGVREACMTTLSLTFDHRATNGVRAAQFLATVAEGLGEPERL